MKVKNIIDEDFINYKKPSMFIITTKCDFKCCREACIDVCQNMDIVKQPDIDVDEEDLVLRYLNNPITKAIVIGGLEPFDTFYDLSELVLMLRRVYQNQDDIVIYTGYNKDEIQDKLSLLSQFDNIIIKYGRYIPGQKEHFDDVLGVNLASDNQYAEVLHG